LPPGDGQIITYSDFSDSTRAFDLHGNLIPVPSYQKFELGTYLELGLTDWLTLLTYGKSRKNREYCCAKLFAFHIFREISGNSKKLVFITRCNLG
jgi:hypothetical protein